MQENGEKKVSRSYDYFTLAIFGLVQFILIAGACSAAYFYLIVPRITEVSKAKIWMEDRVAGKFGMKLSTLRDR